MIRKAEWMGSGRREVRGAGSEEKKEKTEAIEDIQSSENLPPLAASAVPEISTIEVDAEVSEHEVNITLDNRLYRVRGLNKNLSYEQLKVNMLVKEGEVFHVDTFDIYSAKHRASYVKQASHELGISEETIKIDHIL